MNRVLMRWRIFVSAESEFALPSGGGAHGCWATPRVEMLGFEASVSHPACLAVRVGEWSCATRTGRLPTFFYNIGVARVDVSGIGR